MRICGYMKWRVKNVSQLLQNCNDAFHLSKTNFKSKKLYASQMHFDFTNMGSEMHSFRVIAKRHIKF